MYIGRSHEDRLFFFTVSLQIQSFVQEKPNQSHWEIQTFYKESTKRREGFRGHTGVREKPVHSFQGDFNSKH